MSQELYSALRLKLQKSFEYSGTQKVPYIGSLLRNVLDSEFHLKRWKKL